MKTFDLTLELSISGSILRSFVYLENSEDDIHLWDSLGNGKFRKIMKNYQITDDKLTVELYIEGKSGASANLKTSISGTSKKPEIDCVIPNGKNSDDKSTDYVI